MTLAKIFRIQRLFHEHELVVREAVNKNHEEQVINLYHTRFFRIEDGAELAAMIRKVMYEGGKCTSLF